AGRENWDAVLANAPLRTDYFLAEFPPGTDDARGVCGLSCEKRGARTGQRHGGGSYGPLYQAAYMLGALQFRALRKETVSAGHMSNREYHDAILMQNAIPVELLRAKLLNLPLTRDYQTNWKFYEDKPTA